MHIWAIDLWQSDVIAYRSIDHSIASGILPVWVDLLPPLCLRTSSGKVVLERSEVVKSCLRKSHCLTGNLPLSASNPSFPPTLHWSVLQGCKVTHLLCSRRSTWHSLERKRKMFHEANRREESVASAHQSPAARLQRRGA